jgi:hypothetical protein
MKKVVTVTEVEGEGLEAFLGKRIFIICESYFYAGTLTGINSTCVLLEDARFVFESGSFESKGIANSEKIPGGKCYVQKDHIEAYFQSHE